MPLYEYRCSKCGAHFEKIQKFSDPPIATCEVCGGKVERLLSSPAIQFKGSGWYVTDYARKTAEKTSAIGKDDGSSDGKGEKPATTEKSGSAKTEPAPASTGKKDS